MVVDLMLPDGDGAELVAEIKSRRSRLPVVVLSANDDLSGALEAGADVAMNKSMSLPEIVIAL
ncbi:MAG: response regulator [Actinomycetota bacterium]|nr:response regulator [Actinomycetota bacterium]